MENVIGEHIQKTADVCGGKACVAGRRIRVVDIVALHEHRGFSPDEIVAMFRDITLADVHAALAYYFDHQAEIEADFKHDADLANNLRRRFESKLPL